jgi:hypothetical protein
MKKLPPPIKPGDFEEMAHALTWAASDAVTRVIAFARRDENLSDDYAEQAMRTARRDFQRLSDAIATFQRIYFPDA